jgi:hypothetical protein
MKPEKSYRPQLARYCYEEFQTMSVELRGSDTSSAQYLTSRKRKSKGRGGRKLGKADDFERRLRLRRVRRGEIRYG